MGESLNLTIAVILAMGFGLACLLGTLAHRIKLSPIIGYLFAGYLIGPYSPGYTADIHLSEQLAEIGVILMMFGVGLLFHWRDLTKTAPIAIPGAICQTLATAAFSCFVIYTMGWSLQTGILFGLAIAVASTVVLVSVLTSNNLLATPQGHIAVGWLIVEDIITVIVLLLIPTLASENFSGSIPFQHLLLSTAIALLKFGILAVVMLTIGSLIVSYILTKVAQAQSHELFTLATLAITFVIAVGTNLIFGMSIALGAFIAGMVVAKTEVRDQVAGNTLPIREAFMVIFFLSIGMLFNPAALINHFGFFISVLGIIMLVKPIAAFLITIALRYPIKVAVTIALALAQIGEFSFILAEEGSKFNLIPDECYDIIVACGIVSIYCNPLLFKLAKLEKHSP